MSRLGKSFKNRFLRQALAMVLAGTMVMTSMPVSLAAEEQKLLRRKPPRMASCRRRNPPRRRQENPKTER